MPYDILKSSTELPLVFGPLIQSTDHISGLTGVTPTVTISKAGGAFAAPAGAVSEIGNGWYKVAANATDTNTPGPIAVHATATGGDPFDQVVAQVVAYDPQNATNLGLGNLDAAISSRSTYAGADTPGTGTLLGRLTQAIVFDGSGFVKSDVEHWATAVVNALVSGEVQCQVAGYANGQDPWSQLKGATPGNAPTAGTLEWFFRLLDADPYTTNTSGSPWEIAYMVRGSGAPGTGTQLLLKGLYDTAGNPLTSTTVVVGGAH